LEPEPARETSSVLLDTGGAALFRLREKKRSDLMSVTRSELSDIVLFANAAGSLAATKTGGIPAMPSRKDIAQLMSSGKRLDCRRQSEDEAMRHKSGANRPMLFWPAFHWLRLANGQRRKPCLWKFYEQNARQNNK
jgi:hypothetical protein